jgi:small subunit ribosomal protein S2
MKLFRKAYAALSEIIGNGGSVLFVCTKRQGQAIIREEAERCGMYFVNHRWLGGMLTNFQTINIPLNVSKKLNPCRLTVPLIDSQKRDTPDGERAGQA